MSTTAQRVPAPADRAVRAATNFLTRLFRSPRDFSIRLWDEKLIPADVDDRFTLVIRSPEELRGMFRPPAEASLADAYISGSLEVEGDLTAVFGIVETCRRGVRSPTDLIALVNLWRALPEPRAQSSGESVEPARLAGGSHTPQRDSAAVRHHYDLGNDFYSLFLDPRMVYSCGYFATGEESLEAAQHAKLELICRKLSLRSGERLLDVGCGWGGLLIHAARNHGIHGVGITLSERQHDLARQRISDAGLSDRLEVRLADYRTLSGETFDKIASIGMFEHVGESRLPEYFRRLYGVLRPGGLFLNHGISIQMVRPRNDLKALITDPLNRLIVGTSPLTKSVFPDSELIPLSDVNAAAEEAGWEVRDVENLREHYATTLRHWIRNLEQKEADAVRIVGRPTYRAWRLYFAASAYRFDIGRINVNQTLLGKLDAGRVRIPPGREHIFDRPLTGVT